MRLEIPPTQLPAFLTPPRLVLAFMALSLAAWLLPLWATGAILAGSVAAGLHLGNDTPVDIAVGLSGLVTAIPLLMFAIAARRMDYSTLGFVQFIAPTTVFILGLTVFHEPLHPAQLWSYIFIWIAIAVFAWDLLKRHRQLKAATSVLPISSLRGHMAEAMTRGYKHPAKRSGSPTAWLPSWRRTIPWRVNAANSLVPSTTAWTCVSRSLPMP